MDDEQILLQMPLINTIQVTPSINTTETGGNFKHIEGKNGPTAFLPLGSKLGGEVNERISSKC